LVWVWKISTKKSQIFQFFPIGSSKNPSSGWVKRYLGQRQVRLLFTAGQKCARVGSGQGSSLLHSSRFIFFSYNSIYSFAKRLTFFCSIIVWDSKSHTLKLFILLAELNFCRNLFCEKFFFIYV